MPMDFNSSRVFLYMDWIKNKLRLDKFSFNASRRVVRRGQVYYCELGCGVGQEQEKLRPCVVLQNDRQNRSSPNTIVAPITHTASTVNVVVPITTIYDSNGRIVLDGHALLGNIVTVSKGRLGDLIAELPKTDIEKIDTALLVSVQLFDKFETLKRIIVDKDDYINKLKEERDALKETLKELQVKNA